MTAEEATRRALEILATKKADGVRPFDGMSPEQYANWQRASAITREALRVLHSKLVFPDPPWAKRTKRIGRWTVELRA